MKESKAEKIQNLLQLQKSLLKTKQRLTDFQEPIVFLTRRDNTVEFFQKATKGKFCFRHSDGDTRYIELVPSRMLSFPYADKRVRMYFLHEDNPLPLPEDPLITTELIALSQEKLLHDVNTYRIKEEKVRFEGKAKIMWAIVAIIIAIGVAMTLIPSHFWKSLFSDSPKPQNTVPIVTGMISYWWKNDKI